MMKNALVLFLLAGAATLHAETKPLKALLVTGGCCHDYAKQHVLPKERTSHLWCLPHREPERKTKGSLLDYLELLVKKK